MTTTSPANPQRRQLLTAGAAALVGAPALFNIAAAQGGPIKIGFPTPLTGAFSAEAQDQVRAAELAVKEFNAAGGDRKSTRLNSSHPRLSRMPSSA